MASSEALCREWGYEEALLLVESTNSRARKLYAKLGYKPLPGGDEPDAVSVQVQDGRVTDVVVRNVALRKSLKPFPLGPLENLTATSLLLWLSLLGGATAVASLPEDTRDSLLELLLQMRSSFGG
jgi:hypothetical protein